MAVGPGGSPCCPGGMQVASAPCRCSGVLGFQLGGALLLAYCIGRGVRCCSAGTPGDGACCRPPALCSLWAVLRRLPRPLSCLPLPPLLLPPPASFLPSSLLSPRRRRWVLQMDAAVRCTDVSPARTFSNQSPVRPRSLLPRATTAVHALMRNLPLLPGGRRESRHCWSGLGCWESRPRRWRGRIFGARPRPLAARLLLGSLRARRRIALRR